LLVAVINDKGGWPAYNLNGVSKLTSYRFTNRFSQGTVEGITVNSGY